MALPICVADMRSGVAMKVDVGEVGEEGEVAGGSAPWSQAER